MFDRYLSLPLGSPAEKKESTGRSRESFDEGVSGSLELDGAWPELGDGELRVRLKLDWRQQFSKATSLSDIVLPFLVGSATLTVTVLPSQAFLINQIKVFIGTPVQYILDTMLHHPRPFLAAQTNF